MGNDSDVLSIQDVLAIVRRRLWWIVATVVLVAGAAFGLSLVQTPQYEATAELVVNPVRLADDLASEFLTPQQQRDSGVETEARVVESRPVVDRVIEAVGGERQRLLRQTEVNVLSDTRVVTVNVTDPDPVRAAEVADAFVTSYLAYRRDAAVEELLEAGASIQRRAQAITEQITAIEDQLDDDGLADDEAATLEIERDALVSQLAQATAASGGVGIDVAGGGEVLSPADVPTSPVSPQPARNGILGLVLGLLLGLGVAFLRDHLDDGLRDDQSLRKALGGRPVLGRIPHWAGADDSDALVTVAEPASVPGEAYRALSASVRFLLVAEEEQPVDRGRTIVITSSGPGEGKTSTAANLAVAAARVGHRVLLVDADMRRPTLHKRFGLGSSQGLSDLLVSANPLGDYAVSVGVPNLLVVPAGTIPPNPAELLASPAMRALQAEATRHADLVIYDCPPVLAVADALELSRFADLTVLVSRAVQTGRRQLSAAVERLEGVGAHIAGGILNDISTKSDEYLYYYYYEYTSEKADGAAPASKKDRKAAAKAEQRRREVPSVDPSPRASNAPATPRRAEEPPSPRTPDRSAIDPPSATRDEPDRTDDPDTTGPQTARTTSTPSFTRDVRPVTDPGEPAPAASPGPTTPASDEPVRPWRTGGSDLNVPDADRREDEDDEELFGRYYQGGHRS